MVEDKEISALFNLIDDPDEEVFSTVTDKLISFGRAVIPNLENLWENSADEEVQSRIEMIIHQLHFRDLEEEFVNWKNGNCNLLEGALLVSKYCYPEMPANTALQEIEKLRRNIWLELNSYLTPLEQVNVISGILYSYFGLKGNEVNYKNPDEFLLYKTIENKKGNPIINGIIYLILCELLDVPAKAINIPKQFILGYFTVNYNMRDTIEEDEKIIFYIDPINGQVYSQKDVESYFKRIMVPPVPSYYKALDHKKIIRHLIEEFSKCFDSPENYYKRNELLSLANLLDN
ncbi:MAG: transglutaminase-like domain-containing protein [Ginsengibacter sp.]|jgi:regulator of sirC expression with transglutaminase-like and TPR domain